MTDQACGVPENIASLRLQRTSGAPQVICRRRLIRRTDPLAARFQLRPRRRRYDLRLAARQWDDGRGISVFTNSALRRHCIVGSDYYSTNEHRIAAGGSLRPSGGMPAYGEIARISWALPPFAIMHGKANLGEGSGAVPRRRLAARLPKHPVATL